MDIYKLIFILLGLFCTCYGLGALILTWFPPKQMNPRLGKIFLSLGGLMPNKLNRTLNAVFFLLIGAQCFLVGTKELLTLADTSYLNLRTTLSFVAAILAIILLLRRFKRL